MAGGRKPPSRAASLLALFAVWSLPGLIAGLTENLAIARDLAMSHGPTRGEFVLWHVMTWWPWMVFTPIILDLVRRVPPDSQRLAWWLRLPVHALAWAVLASIHTAISALVVTRAPALLPGLGLGPGLGPDVSFTTIADHLLARALPETLLAYAAVVGYGVALDYRRRWKTGKDEAQALEAKLSKAQLEALKMQLHPHFLFNSLHALGVLVRKRDTRGALRMLIGLSDLLRITLDNAGKQVVPLRQELSFLDRYLRVEQVRFGDRLEIERDIDQDVLDAIVPSLALQPLLENAIRHGIAPRDAPGSIRLTARRTDDERLRLEVADDGVGLAEDSAEISGMGLANVRARLDQLYGSRHRFEISDREDRPGVVAAIEIPLNFELESSTNDG